MTCDCHCGTMVSPRNRCTRHPSMVNLCVCQNSLGLLGWERIFEDVIDVATYNSFIQIRSNGNSVYNRFSIHHSHYSMSTIWANSGEFPTLFEVKEKCASLVVRGTVCTDLVYTFPVKVWVRYRAINGNLREMNAILQNFFETVCTKHFS